METICVALDEMERCLLNGEVKEARKKLITARSMAERMECRLLRYRRSIEVLGFTRDKKTETEET